MHVEHMPSAGKHLQQNPQVKMFYIDDMMALTQPPLKKQWMPSHPDVHGIIPNGEKLVGSNLIVPVVLWCPCVQVHEGIMLVSKLATHILAVGARP